MRKMLRLLQGLGAGLALAFGQFPAVQAGSAASHTYDVTYEVTLAPQTGIAHVSIGLTGATLPSRLTFTIDPKRYRDFKGDGKLERKEQTLAWYPPRDGGTLSFNFQVDNQRSGRSYDSYMTHDWAIFRGDRLIPPISVLAPRGLTAQATLEFRLPAEWSVVTRYTEPARHRFAIENPGRLFQRPTGWMLAGKIGTRRESIAGINAIVAAPMGDAARRQDTLAFLSWNLPHLIETFPEFPQRLLVIRAGEPMFRGGLSGPGSLFLHSDRPLISENRTSTLLHELVHVAMGIRSDQESDWIVEGFAEYYSIETLRRSGGISERRFQEAIERQGNWGRRAPNLFVRTSTGAVTARAVTVLQEVDTEIRQATGNKASLDDIARELAAERGEVTLERLQTLSARIAGKPIRALDRARLQSGQ